MAHAHFDRDRVQPIPAAQRASVPGPAGGRAAPTSSETDDDTAASTDGRPPVVFVVDDDRAFRESLAALLESVGLEVECYEQGQSFLERDDPNRPGCAVVDVRMARIGGLTLLQRIQDRAPTVPVIMVSGYLDVGVAVEAMKLGAFDFLTKPFHDQEFLEIVNRALEEDARRRSAYLEYKAFCVRLARLTPRARQVLEHMVVGRTNVAIAEELRITKRTVELHRVQCMKKMHAKSLAELVAVCTHFGWPEGWPEKR